MALTLRDSHSYETQIIDAVRSVNKALGGTYGKSSAIYKSEFNQYEVQLIDAIKGIARTLSGNGLSVTAVGGGASAEALQDLTQRVSKLEGESFFRIVDGNITLKTEYRNLWVPGWLAAGGIGTGGGGRSYLRELEDVYHDTAGILRGNGDPVAHGDLLVYDSTTDPLNPRWVAAAPAGGGSITVTNYGDTTSGRIATVAGTDIYNGVKWGSAGQTANTFSLTINGTTKTVCLDGYDSGGGGGGTVTGYIGTTQVQSTAAAQGLTGILSLNATSDSSSASRIVWDSVNGAWHVLGNLYADGWIAAEGQGGSGGGGSTNLAAVWDSLTNTVADPYANTIINIAHIPNISTSMIPDLETWIFGKGYLALGSAYTLRTPVLATAGNGTLLGVDALSNGSASVPGSDDSRIEWDSVNEAWHVYGNLYADGWVAAGGIGSGGGVSVEHLSDIGDVSLSSPTDGQALVWDETNSVWKNGTVGSSYTLPIASSSTLGGIKVGSGLSIDANGVLSASGGSSNGYIGNPGHATTMSDVVLSTFQTRQVLYYVGSNKWTNARLELPDIFLPSSMTGSSGYLYYQNGSGWSLVSGGGGGGYVLPIASSSTLGGIKVGTGLSINSSSGVLSVPIASSSVLGGIKVGSGLSINSSGVLSVTGGGGGGSTVTVTQVLSSGTKIATITVDNVPTDLYAPSGGGGGGGISIDDVWSSLTSSSGTYGNTKINSSHIPDLSGTYVTLSTTQNNISGAKTFTTNPVTIAATSGLSVNASSYIDIGNARLVFDSGTNALHVTKKSGTSATIGLFADGFVAAGGVSGQTTSSYVDLESAQTIGGAKTFTGAMSLSSTLNVNGVTLTGSSSKLSISQNTEFSGITGVTGGKITVQNIVDRIIALENA